MNVVVFYDYFTPAYQAGGPIRSLYNLVSNIRSCQFYVITGNQDLDGSFLEVTPNIWTKFSESVEVAYLERKNRNRTFIQKLLGSLPYDFIYVNGIFSLFTTWLPLALARRNHKKVLIAPRGMLQKGALSIKPLKKRAFLTLLKWRFLNNRNIYWHATDPQEVEDIRSVLGGRSRVFEVGNVPSFDVPYELRKKELSQPVRFVTISLIARKKNHSFFLKVLKELNTGHAIQYDIYGPASDSVYLVELKKQLTHLPGNIKVSILPPIRPDKVSEVLNSYHYFVLPTKGENFGHAIFEAFNIGLPVIISDLTPWRNLNDKSAGWDLSLDASRWSQVVKKAITLDAASYEKMQKGSREVAEQYIKETDLTGGYEKMFETVISDRI